VSTGVAKLVLESVREAEDLDALAAQQGCIQPVLLRIAPASLPRGFGINMAGQADTVRRRRRRCSGRAAAIRKLRHLKLIGFHAYSGTQCVDAKAVGENFGIFSRIFCSLAEQSDLRPEALVFGAGFGIPYHGGMNALDVPAVVRRFGTRIRAACLRSAHGRREGFISRWAVTWSARRAST
jgi:diaminopimelate decarboxylase